MPRRLSIKGGGCQKPHAPGGAAAHQPFRERSRGLFTRIRPADTTGRSPPARVRSLVADFIRRLPDRLTNFDLQRLAKGMDHRFGEAASNRPNPMKIEPLVRPTARARAGFRNQVLALCASRA